MDQDNSMLNIFGRMKKHYNLGYRPHLVPSAIAFIASKINKRSKILELGAGSSTIWFAKRARQVISYEHDRLCSETMQILLDYYGLKNVELHHDPKYPSKGIPDHDQARFQKEPFDFILVDGRGRIKNTRVCVPLLKSGGYFILDDSNRNNYRHARSLLDSKKWPHFDFRITENSPFNVVLMTTIWRKS